MRPRRLIYLTIVLTSLLSGCAGVERRSGGGKPAQGQVERSDRAELLEELSLYSD